jgi:hypothetical protein
MNFVDPRVGNGFLRKLVGLPAEPNQFARIRAANGVSPDFSPSYFDKEHRPLVVMQAA